MVLAGLPAWPSLAPCWPVCADSPAPDDWLPEAEGLAPAGADGELDPDGDDEPWPGLPGGEPAWGNGDEVPPGEPAGELLPWEPGDWMLVELQAPVANRIRASSIGPKIVCTTLSIRPLPALIQRGLTLYTPDDPALPCIGARPRPKVQFSAQARHRPPENRPHGGFCQTRLPMPG